MFFSFVSVSSFARLVCTRRGALLHTAPSALCVTFGASWRHAGYKKGPSPPLPPPKVKTVFIFAH